MTIEGYVPNDVVHETLVATARATLPSATIDDRTAIASGEPEGFAEAATFAINALGRLREGGVMLDGLTLDMAGEARSVDDYQAVVDGVGGQLPDGSMLVASEITPAFVDALRLERPSGRRRVVVLRVRADARPGRDEVAADAAHRSLPACR